MYHPKKPRKGCLILIKHPKKLTPQIPHLRVAVILSYSLHTAGRSATSAIFSIFLALQSINILLSTSLAVLFVALQTIDHYMTTNSVLHLHTPQALIL